MRSGARACYVNQIHLTRSSVLFCPYVRTAKPVPTLAEHALTQGGAAACAGATMGM